MLSYEQIKTAANDLVEQDEWVVRIALNSLASLGDRQTSNTEERLSRMVGALRAKRRSYRGSEVEDTQIAELVEKIQSVESALDVWTQLRHDAVRVLKEELGETWTPYSASGTQDRTQTLAAKDADRILARYSSDEE